MVRMRKLEQGRTAPTMCAKTLKLAFTLSETHDIHISNLFGCKLCVDGHVSRPWL